MGQWWAECPPADTGKRVEVVKALLDARVDVNLWGRSSDPKSMQPVTGLMQACLQGSVECVDLLLAANAQIDAENSLGNTALHLAAQYGIYLALSLACLCLCQCLCVRVCVCKEVLLALL
jgi:ankyrin repeat protein